MPGPRHQAQPGRSGSWPDRRKNRPRHLPGRTGHGQPQGHFAGAANLARHRRRDNWTLSPRFQYMEFNVGGTQIFMNSVRADRRTINRSGRADSRNDFMYTGQLDLKGKFDTGFISHQVLIGGEYEDATSNGGWTALNGVPAMDALNPTYLSTQLTPGKAFVFRNDKRIGSFYFQDMMAITDKFDLFGGVRQSNVAGSKLAANGAATQYDLDNKSFQVGGAYHVLEPVTLFAGYGTGFDVDASFAAQAARATAFKPEKSDQVEAGVKLALPFGLTSTASFFDITRSNVVTPDPANPGFNAQVGEMRSRGAEIDLAYQINKQWFVQAGYALIDAKITKSQNGDVGNRPWDVAPHQANVWTRYKFDEGLLKDLSLGAGANFVAKRPGDNAHTFDLPAYTTVDMSASYQWKKVKAELFALNMLDKHYYTSNDQMTGAFTGAPRQIYGRLTLEF
ncbi:TonB-dependent receptor [Methylogaea oryzae]|uniref:TonB-dependent receptor n=1 Tax=Methylogaea oryzae TaxID=1295382 RepID=UPI0020D01094|nr:TonB-dependent receptor [Methylogaea oryzae]